MDPGHVTGARSHVDSPAVGRRCGYGGGGLLGAPAAAYPGRGRSSRSTFAAAVKVWHRRFVPAVHAFWYSIFFSYLDLQVRRPDAAEGGGGACRPTTVGTRRQPGCVGA